MADGFRACTQAVSRAGRGVCLSTVVSEALADPSACPFSVLLAEHVASGARSWCGGAVVRWLLCRRCRRWMSKVREAGKCRTDRGCHTRLAPLLPFSPSRNPAIPHLLHSSFLPGRPLQQPLPCLSPSLCRLPPQSSLDGRQTGSQFIFRPSPTAVSSTLPHYHSHPPR